MRFAPYDRDRHQIDPGPYLAALGSFAEQLPPGARSFADYPEHYDYGAYRRGADDERPPGTPFCTKDLKLRTLVVETPIRGVEMTAKFAFPGDHAPADLTIRYLDVGELSLVDATGSAEPIARSTRLGRLMIDEVVPDDVGAAHFMDFEWGSLVVRCADLRAEWR